MMIAIGRVISRSADGPLYALAGVALLLTGQYVIFALSAAILSSERLIYLQLKSSLRRNRPPEAIPGFKSIVQPGDQFSFPSGHTSAAFLFAGLGEHFLPGIGLLLYPWAALVGCSRVVLGVHFPTDTLAGALLGHSLCQLGLFMATTYGLISL